ncbi:alkaline shock response membrane anchor protein AmaP [Desulfitibacter alkalitolerans]|uniref:alkaline shock response membrane anchor protein AmaP n=1 Tax=Desulfitibacter alkalitolerans TaxID=264641 RepID=UPI000683E9A0|nr:alkaline shock response membrane anchor protein AmaP [Desulfitibacter alkalitolerans]
MSFGNRLSNVFFSLLGLALAIVIFAASLGWGLPIRLLLEQLEIRDVRLAMAAVSLVVAIWAIYSLQIGLRKKPEVKYTQIDSTEHGQIHITMEAIENFVTRAAGTIKEVKEVKPRIKILPEGMALLLKITIIPDTNVPNVTRDIQEKVSHYLKEYGGIEVFDVEVVVDKIAQPVRSRVD